MEHNTYKHLASTAQLGGLWAPPLVLYWWGGAYKSFGKHKQEVNKGSHGWFTHFFTEKESLGPTCHSFQSPINWHFQLFLLLQHLFSRKGLQHIYIGKKGIMHSGASSSRIMGDLGLCYIALLQFKTQTCIGRRHRADIRIRILNAAMYAFT